MEILAVVMDLLGPFKSSGLCFLLQTCFCESSRWGARKELWISAKGVQRQTVLFWALQPAGAGRGHHLSNMRKPPDVLVSKRHTSKLQSETTRLGSWIGDRALQGRHRTSLFQCSEEVLTAGKISLNIAHSLGHSLHLRHARLSQPALT